MTKTAEIQHRYPMDQQTDWQTDQNTNSYSCVHATKNLKKKFGKRREGKKIAQVEVKLKN